MASNRDVTGGGLPAEAITNREFNQVRRGYDPIEVKRYLHEIADDLARLRTRNDGLSAELARARDAAAHPVLSEEAIVAAVGEEMASTLRSAHSAATEMKNRAAGEAERLVADARSRAESISAEIRARASEVSARADSKLAKVEAEADGKLSAAADEAEGRIARARREAEDTVSSARQTATADAARIMAKARIDAESVRQQADEERKASVEGAQAIRERVLGDLARRRRVATVQIEQLRAGRERLLESYAVVRRTLDEVSEELQRADSDARAAADEAGRRLEAAQPTDDGPIAVDASVPTPTTVTEPAGDQPGARLDDDGPSPAEHVQAPGGDDAHDESPTQGRVSAGLATPGWANEGWGNDDWSAGRAYPADEDTGTVDVVRDAPTSGSTDPGADGVTPGGDRAGGESAEAHPHETRSGDQDGGAADGPAVDGPATETAAIETAATEGAAAEAAAAEAAATGGTGDDSAAHAATSGSGADTAADTPAADPTVEASAVPSSDGRPSEATGSGPSGADTPGVDTHGADTHGADTLGADTPGADPAGDDAPVFAAPQGNGHDSGAGPVAGEHPSDGAGDQGWSDDRPGTAQGVLDDTVDRGAEDGPVDGTPTGGDDGTLFEQAGSAVDPTATHTTTAAVIAATSEAVVAATGQAVTGQAVTGQAVTGRDRVRLVRGDGPDAPAAGAATRPALNARLRVLDGGSTALAYARLEEEPATMAASEPPTGLELVAEPGPAPRDHLETLFERIRADRERSAAAEPVGGGDAAVAPEAADVVANPVETPAPATPRSSFDTDSGVTRSDADELQLQRRDAELDDVQLGLTRRMKRALQDEHNDLLDRLRSARGPASIDEAVGTRGEQAGRYVSVAHPFVERAARCGAGFLVAVDGDNADRTVAAVSAARVADLVAAVVDPLRARIEVVLDDLADEARETLVDALAAVYRETRSHRLEPLVADSLSAAHTEAAWRMAPGGSTVRWVAEDADGPCPDCDDNSLAGPLPKGEVFPTGQLHPPAHQGCHCLLVLDAD